MKTEKAILDAISKASNLSLSESDLHQKIFIPIKTTYNAIAIYANQSKWIPVSERLPELSDADKNGKVLLYREMNKSQEALSISVHDWYSVKFCAEDSLWQPLPPLPEKP